jgi:hypothetical protein
MERIDRAEIVANQVIVLNKRGLPAEPPETNQP